MRLRRSSKSSWSNHCYSRAMSKGFFGHAVAAWQLTHEQFITQGGPC
ncbi:unnamed protein product [Calypogeia fissa]